MERLISLGIIALAIGACSSMPSKKIIETSGDQPSWTKKSAITWNDGSDIFFKNKYTINNNQRVSACYTLAKIDSKTELLGQIQSEVKQVIDSTTQSISEDAEILLSDSKSLQLEGKIRNLKHLEQYHERYLLPETQQAKVDCLYDILKSETDRAQN